MIFWTEDNWCFISDCWNLFNCKFKKLINEQIIIFYSPSNAIYSSEESVQIKHFNKMFTKFNKVWRWVLSFEVPRNFHKSFFVKNVFVKNFFVKSFLLFQLEAMQSALFKNEKKSSQKRCMSPRNCLAKQGTEEKHWKERKKNDKIESQTTTKNNV